MCANGMCLYVLSVLCAYIQYMREKRKHTRERERERERVDYLAHKLDVVCPTKVTQTTYVGQTLSASEQELLQ